MLTQSKQKPFVKSGDYRHINITDYETTSMSMTPGGEKVPNRILKDGQTRTTTKIIEFLRQEGQAATVTIFEFLNDQKRSRLRSGCTMSRLGNLLAKNPEFEEVDKVYLNDKYYDVKVWRLSNWV